MTGNMVLLKLKHTFEWRNGKKTFFANQRNHWRCSLLLIIASCKYNKISPEFCQRTVTAQDGDDWQSLAEALGVNYTVLAVSNCVGHDGTSYAVLKHVEVVFWCGTCRCDTGTQSSVHRSMWKLFGLVSSWLLQLEQNCGNVFFYLLPTSSFLSVHILLLILLNNPDNIKHGLNLSSEPGILIMAVSLCSSIFL